MIIRFLLAKIFYISATGLLKETFVCGFRFVQACSDSIAWNLLCKGFIQIPRYYVSPTPFQVVPTLCDPHMHSVRGVNGEYNLMRPILLYLEAVGSTLPGSFKNIIMYMGFCTTSHYMVRWTFILQAKLRWPTELAINPLDNSLYFIDDHMILKLTKDQRLLVVAGQPV